MAMLPDYDAKLAGFEKQSSFSNLKPESQDLVLRLAKRYQLTFQQFRQLVEGYRDLAMWGEDLPESWWNGPVSEPMNGNRLQKRKELMRCFNEHLETLKAQPKEYSATPVGRPKKREKSRIVSEASDKKIHGQCPVASEKTVCCNLHTIDAVENCIFGCSYCAIQTFYHDEIVFDAGFAEKLKNISLDPNRFYHYGTGQSSDSLAWGNRFGNLDALCAFAAEHPNVLLEFKTKSDNVAYLLENEIPSNVVCSWSLNTQPVIDNEEHFTASLDERIAAARRVADAGVKVAFHFHPMVFYDGWDTHYPETAGRLTEGFTVDEVLFISFGSVTLIKPAIKKIRDLGHPTKILQMQFVQDPHGKFTYPDEVKTTMFRRMYEAFTLWQGKVFFYLCMEKASIWTESLGYVYASNEVFEKDFGSKTMSKIGKVKFSEDRIVPMP